MGAFVISPLPPMSTKTSCAARPLCSTGITPFHRSCGPGRHRLAVTPLPGVAGYRAYLAPILSDRDEDGFSSCPVCPCHRAIPTTPPERDTSTVSLRYHLLPSPRGSGLGLRSYILTRPPLGSLALRPGDSLTVPRTALSASFIRFVSSTNVTQVTGL